MNEISILLMCLAGALGGITLILALWKTRWASVEALCVDCELNQAGAHYKMSGRKRHYLSGYKSTFTFNYNGQEYTGSQPYRYNPGKCMPRCYYTIKVNPRNPQVVATKTELIAKYIIASLCLALIIYMLIAG